MDIDLRTLLAKLNAECRRALEQAAELCVRHTNYNVEIEHLLLKLIELPAPDLDVILRHYDVKSESLAAQLTQAIERFKRGNGRTPAMSPHFITLLQEAWLVASMQLATCISLDAATKCISEVAITCIQLRSKTFLERIQTS